MATRDRARLGAKGLIASVLAVAAFVGPLGQPTPARSAIRIEGASQGQRDMVEWGHQAVPGRGSVGPRVEIRFDAPADEAPCDQDGGFYRSGRIDLCTGAEVDAYARKVIVHEMAHLWADWNMGVDEQQAFLELRGLPTWNEWSFPWAERGTEQVAEVITWAIGEGILIPIIPDDSPEELTAAYRALTGSQPPILLQQA